MDKLFIVTGSSKGLGKGLVDALIKDHKVIGISRTNDFQHSSFTWLKCDFSQPASIDSLDLNIEADEIVLINNAGWIGPIKHVGNQSSQEIVDLFNINVSSVFAITNKLVSWTKKTGNKLTVINVSSGAATAVIDGWSAYCASKAAINSFSEILQHESKLNKLPIRVHALSPGVIDSPMQAEIRNTESTDFSRVADFQGMKENDELQTAKETAEKVLFIIDNPDRFSEVLVSVRDL